MTRILKSPLYLNHTCNDNSPDTYFMREVYVGFKQAQYIPVGVGDVMPTNFIVVEV